MALEYNQEKFEIAVDDLQSDIGTLQSRLYKAFAFNLIYVDRGLLPEEVKDNFDELMTELRGFVKTNDPKDKKSKVFYISDETAKKCAKKIIDIYNSIK